MNDLFDVIGGKYELKVHRLLENAKEKYCDDIDWDEPTNDFDVDYVIDYLYEGYDEIDSITKEDDYLDHHYEEIKNEIEEWIETYQDYINEIIEDEKWEQKNGRY